MRSLTILLVMVFLLGGFGSSTHAQSNISYSLRFPNATHNEAEATLTIHNVDMDSVHIGMSRSSPGRYALHEFVKSVYDVSIVDGEGNELNFSRPDLHNWTIEGHHQTIKFSYTVYGDHAGGTYDGINRQHAHLNAPATFAYIKDWMDKPITVQFYPPQGSRWKIATQLKPTDQPFTFTAPNIPYLMDSPAELSNFDVDSWKIHDGHDTYIMRMAMHHNGSHQQFENFIRKTRKIVAEEEAVYGEFPAYDYGTYTFIMGYLPYVFRDGMEHRNSTVITGKHPLKNHALQNLYSVSHEFFHCWNVERLRPTGIKPFNFQQANVSKALWFAEGFTNYYDDLVIRRAGLIDNKKYANGWNSVLSYVYNSPGSKFYNVAQMSMQAPFVDAATAIDHQNKLNTFISYYSWGSAIGLGLDLTLRTKFAGITLDDYMRALWKKYGKTEQAYNLHDLRQTLADVTGDDAFAKQFFNKYVLGHGLINLKPLLAKAGFLLRKAHPGRAVISFRGNKISFRRDKPTISANTIIGSPLYEADIDRGDQILELNGHSLDSAKELKNVLSDHKPGDTLDVKYKAEGETFSRKLRLAGDPALKLVPYEQVNKTLTPGMKAFRKRWLGSKSE